MHDLSSSFLGSFFSCSELAIVLLAVSMILVERMAIKMAKKFLEDKEVVEDIVEDLIAH